ncbi:MAG: alpha/beta fold hydrolase [Myxococcales bacterium]|nr:alpha/beta fold hydrolase [Myxococcales bacterium]
MPNPLRDISIESGRLRFDALSQGEGPLVLCLHGFPDHNRSFLPLLDALAASGYHGVAPLIRGYQPESQSSDGRYPLHRMAADVIAWADALAAPRFHVVGHDWGAVIGYAAAARFPQRLLSLSTMAVPHLRGPQDLAKVPSQLFKSWYMLFFQLPWLPEIAIELGDFALIEFLWRRWSPGYRLAPAEIAAIKRTFSQHGVKRAALGYYRGLRDLVSSEGRRSLALFSKPIHVPTLALTGADDGCIDTRLYDRAFDRRRFPAGLQVERIHGAGHFLHLEEPEKVNQHIVAWIERHDDRGTDRAQGEHDGRR